MKRKTPISVDILQLYTYNRDETVDLGFIEKFPYDDRHDFLVDSFLGGIAVKIALSNYNIDKGARRNISLSLVDMTARCEVGKRQIMICLAKDDFKFVHTHFPVESSELIAGHTYKLVVSDETASQTLAESIIHLLTKANRGEPTEWYEICDGGIRPSWKEGLFKSLNTVDGHDYMVQFNVMPQIGCLLPSVMPELEIRLYYPEGSCVKSFFKEPFCRNQENYDNRRWTVECIFETSEYVNGVFYAELLCMKCPIAGFVFDTTCANEVSGAWSGYEILPFEKYSHGAALELIDEYLPNRNDCNTISDKDSIDDLIDRFIASESKNSGDDVSKLDDSEEKDNVKGIKVDPLVALDQLTGLRSVKEKLRVYERVVRFNKMRADKGLPITATPLHAMFLGSPGTGKTTVAKMMGSMLRRAGVLSKGHVVVRERATLLGQNYHSESEKTLAAIEEAKGGILFIDEAHQLNQAKDPRDPGKFVIETLLTALSDNNNRNWMLILAGYPDEMKRMFDMNPGFKSRIPDSNIYAFEDFTEAELMEIAENYLARYCYTLSDDAYNALSVRLKADYSRHEKSFGNARHVVNMIETEILPSMAVRVINEGLTNDSALTEIQQADIPSPLIKPIASRSRVGFIQ